MKYDYDVIVLGAGGAGLTAAIGASGIGASVLLIEMDKLGGDCTHYGCIPSKTLIREAKKFFEAKEYFKIDLKINIQDILLKTQNTVRAVQERFESIERLNTLGVDVVIGKAIFLDKHTVAVEKKKYTAKKFVIATGGNPARIHTKGFETLDYLTNRTIFIPKKIESLIVIGSGPIGCELAQAFNRLGVKVTILTKDSTILNREDSRASKIVQDTLIKEGVTIIFNTEILEGFKVATQKSVKIKVSNKENIITADEVLVAVGRSPHVENIGLETIGVDFDKNKGIMVNDHAQTNLSNIYAIGDVTASSPKFTHFANHHAKVALTHMFFTFFAHTEKIVIPRVTFTTPEIASVGISTEKEVHEKGYFIFTKEYTDIDRAITDGNEVGFLQIVTDAKGAIKGATLVGTSSGELINEIALAMKQNIKITALADTIHAYPTYGYGLRSCADQFRAKSYSPLKKKIVKAILQLNGKNTTN